METRAELRCAWRPGSVSWSRVTDRPVSSPDWVRSRLGIRAGCWQVAAWEPADGLRPAGETLPSPESARGIGRLIAPAVSRKAASEVPAQARSVQRTRLWFAHAPGGGRSRALVDGECSWLPSPPPCSCPMGSPAPDVCPGGGLLLPALGGPGERPGLPSRGWRQPPLSPGSRRPVSAIPSWGAGGAGLRVPPQPDASPTLLLLRGPQAPGLCVPRGPCRLCSRHCCAVAPGHGLLSPPSWA